MKNQLHIPIIELKALGFVRDTSSESKLTYKLKGINSDLIYNPEEPQYVWYHRTVLGEASNYLHLDIQDVGELGVLLKILKLKDRPPYL